MNGQKSEGLVYKRSATRWQGVESDRSPKKREENPTAHLINSRGGVALRPRMGRFLKGGRGGRGEEERSVALITAMYFSRLCVGIFRVTFVLSR